MSRFFFFQVINCGYKYNINIQFQFNPQFVIQNLSSPIIKTGIFAGTDPGVSLLMPAGPNLRAGPPQFDARASSPAAKSRKAQTQQQSPNKSQAGSPGAASSPGGASQASGGQQSPSQSPQKGGNSAVRDRNHRDKNADRLREMERGKLRKNVNPAANNCAILANRYWVAGGN